MTSVQSSVKTLGDVVSETQKNTAQMQNNRIDDMKNMLAEKQRVLQKICPRIWKGLKTGSKPWR